MIFVPFVGAKLKIVRAYDHLKALNNEVDATLARQPNAVVGEIEPDSGDKVYRAHLKWEPPREWGLTLGDCIHNLRSALDHMVWDLVILNGETPDPKTEFPIYGDPAQYRLKHEAPRKLRGVPAEAAEVIEEAQPYHSPRPRSSPLWALRELDIIDKHRSLLLTSSIVALRSFGHFGDLPEPVTMGGTAFEDEQEVFRVPARTHAENRLHPTFTCDVALHKGGVYGGLALREITHLLYGVVSRHLHYMEYRLLGASPSATGYYPHVADGAPASTVPPKCKLIERS